MRCGFPCGDDDAYPRGSGGGRIESCQALFVWLILADAGTLSHFTERGTRLRTGP